MTKNILLYVLAFTLSVFCAEAQNSISFSKKNFKSDIAGLEKAKQYIAYGNRYFELGKPAYHKAVLFYEKAYAFNSNNAELNLKMAKCYLQTDDKDRAKRHLESYIRLMPGKNALGYLYLGKLQQYNYRFDEAEKSFKTFLDKANFFEKQKYKYQAEKHIEECKAGRVFYNIASADKIEQLGTNINSAYSDYHPIPSFSGDTLLYSSRKVNNNTEQKEIDSTDFQCFEDVFIATNINNESRNKGHEYNSKYHDALLYKSGNYELLYRADEKDQILIRNSSSATIGFSPLPSSINKQGHTGTAALSPGGDTLYFSRGKAGEKDLFFVTKNEDDQWHKATKLPETINSEYDEDGIYIEPDGKTLYFSSKGHNTMGGYDIFVTRLMPDGTWAKPENMGYPVNSTGNDIHFKVADSGRFAYFASDRKGTYGKHDIYRMDYTDYFEKHLGSDSVIVETSIEFEYASSKLKQSSHATIDRYVRFLIQNPDKKLEISGHTDNTGKYDDNKILSEERAETVKNYILSKGIPPEQLSSAGYSSDKPIASNDTEAGRKKNRRVEFKIVSK